MDPLAITYYAAICCALAGISPQIPGRVRRYVAGAAIGAISAITLPFVRLLIWG